MVQAQEWLDKNYPKNGTCLRKKREGSSLNHKDYGKKREEITNLDLTYQNLAGVLDCSDFINLEGLWCWNNQLTELILPPLPNLIVLDCDNNYLTKLDFSSQLNPEQLEELKISDNNFLVSDLTIFSAFINLKGLWIGNWEAEKIAQGIYNRFRGSLAPLQDLGKLKELFISNTDLNSGLEYLPDSLTRFYCSADKRPTALVSSLDQELKVYGEPEWDNYISLLKTWKEAEQKFQESFQEKFPFLTQLINQEKEISHLQKLLKNKEHLTPWLEYSLITKEDFAKCLPVNYYHWQ